MWSRQEVKSYARDFLKRHYLKAFLVCLIAWALGGGITKNIKWEESIHHNRFMTGSNNITMKSKNPFTDFALRKARSPFAFKLATGMIPIAALFAFAFTTFVSNAVEVGKVRYFLKGFDNDYDADVGILFSTFNGEEYYGVVKTQFFKGLYIFLWGLLLVIPGIIKSYEYRMVPYIISKKPNMPYDEAIRVSRYMTDGHKWNMFVLDLSFIGWHILGALFFGIGGLFVIPYEEASFARLFNILSGYDDMNIEPDYQINE